MPTVRWEDIRREAQALAASSGDPADFLPQWEALLERHANRRFRPGQSLPPSTLPAYHTPPAVLTAVWQALRAHLQMREHLILPLADALWEHNILESRQLASRLLGLAPVVPETPVITRLWDWLASTTDITLQQELLQHGTRRLVSEAPQAYLEAVRQAVAQPQRVRLGLAALPPLLASPAFQNLPRVFRLLTPLLEAPDPDLRPELVAVLLAAARRWPEETTPYLRSLWHNYPHPILAWLIRRVLPALPDEHASALQEILET